ncbi:hypothetical protein J32TS6_30610 [Virgibacillus pantothenticus]|uniref:Hydrolase n=1 Tax=Virgibacillus pantothenticus TaxID=1473 RepID=A0A0L0QL69_VIRPA|nr:MULTISPECIES: HAD family hydrolase [Virgibacillus]API91590.1 hypothetical protein BKP57_06900 [Virgibacillus sp. 6R]KNE19337.1 hypothetical protein AFK71_12570 [Virgibacillus pantothenticus]MBS7426889.1 Cof-type HAD-IIB family hydrolase [Virgibacillus sp. 19R1-5]MED3738282.1 HAD family hydrolase [Virgibacillus pantothenticus]QTY15819.1 Cof-type HAD-IIB family hydrolase [Virgibacillus pantothenticus]
MNKKVIFIDVDGTLTTPDGKVPSSAKHAIRAARENGHIVYLCTGRSRPEIISSILEIGFDGIIGAGGGYIEVNNELVHHQTMPEDSVRQIIAYFHRYQIGYYLESNDGLFGSENCKDVIRKRITEGLPEGSEAFENADLEFHWFYQLLDSYQHKAIDYGNVNKISFISSKAHPFQEISNTFDKEFTMYRTTVAQFGSESGEIAVKGVDKYKAVEFVLDYLQIPKEQSMAYGDGNNDIKMFKAVHYGIAMENATENLKKVAKEITSKAENDGLMRSFKRHQLL